MKTNIKRVIFSILVIVNCIVIFNFSSENSEKSSETSGVVVEKVVKTITKVNKKAKKETLKDKVTFVVRKCAHFSIYTLLGVWLMCLSGTFNIPFRRRILLCLIFGFLYAASDEIHQSFVGGRSCEFRDVCIDTSGVFVGSVITGVIGKLAKNRLTKSSNIN